MSEIPQTDNQREYPNEYTEVERPLLMQLAAMGWQYVRGDLDYPQKTFRERFRDVVLRDKLRQAIRRINRDENGNEYLDDVTIDRAIREFLTTTEFGTFDKNRELTERLIRGVSVDPAEGTGEAGQRSLPIKLIEFDPEHLDRNEFLAINQFRVGFIGRTGFVIPDIVLFVNGIPLAVIECKSPSITEPMQAGIDQLLRYSNNRPEVEETEGVEHLFLFNQLMISTWFNDLTVAVRRSARRKHVDLTVERDGGVTVSVPAAMELPNVERLVRQRLVTLHSVLSRKREVLSDRPAKEYVTGEGFYFLGRKYRLKLVADVSDAGLRLQDGRFVLPRHRAEEGRALFIDWYTERAQRWLTERIRILQRRVAVQPKGVKVRDLGYRWGSCSKDGMLYFHWRVILLPPVRIEYLVLHELCHLHEHDHSEAFYARLRRASPDDCAHDAWLRAHGDDYRL